MPLRIRSTSTTRLAGIPSAAPGSKGCDQGGQPGGVRGEQAGEPRLVERPRQRDGVSDGVAREELQRDRHVAEREVQVHEADLAPPPVSQGGGEVGGDRRLPAAALGREDRDDPTPWGVVLSVLLALDLLADLTTDLVRPPDGVGQGGELAVRDDLTDTGPEGLGEHARVQAPPHQDHAEGGVLPSDRLGEVERSLGVDGDTEDDDVLPRVLLEVASHLVEAGQERAVTADGVGQRLRCLGVVVDDDGHLVAPVQLNRLSAFVPWSGSTLDSSLRRPR